MPEEIEAINLIVKVNEEGNESEDELVDSAEEWFRQTPSSFKMGEGWTPLNMQNLVEPEDSSNSVGMCLWQEF